MDFCWKHVPEYSVFTLRGRGIDPWELYRQGVIKLQDVPLDSLNRMQRMQAEYYLDKKSHADPAELSRLRKALLEYCRQDTLGLVRLLEKMRTMEAEGGKG
jgi:hypothetical protein